MSIERFAAYAAAFEQSYKDDDWSRIEPFFAENAVYEVPLPPPLGGRFEGRDAILAYFPRVLDGFDRHFAKRRVELLKGPELRPDGSVWLEGRAIYNAPGVPELSFDLEEQAWFEGDRIVRLEDRYSQSEQTQMGRYLAEHGAKLGLGAPTSAS